jgi:hypothetical protein
MESIESGEPRDGLALPRVETPTNLRPDLSLFGIEEIDKGICEDNQANRSILRANKMSWRLVFDDNGAPTSNIEAISADMYKARALSNLEDRKALLEDPRDKNSDYISGLALLIEDKADNLVPPWVISATRTFVDTERKRVDNPTKRYKTVFVNPPSRCRYIKSDGIRCQLWTAGRETDDGFCRTHLASVAHKSTGAVERARERIFQSAPRAVDVLEEMMEATSEVVRLKAATEVLDRAGVRAGSEIDVNMNVQVRPSSELIAERLAKLKAGAGNIDRILEANHRTANNEEIVDAVVVDDDGNTENDA